ncbi:MAG: hypothetical protein OdinLCB4_004195 [Candidatus Odinarchaeum yellowstonii]|jgi:hypothetical protein|uniref:Uncharacterized protein n=1 Tax=Odinarchaeota yellowstonii (strain LCB_4) TaxID=1841599 RepID=A0AAF0D160_ODILC|nr:MAG: hypothetical protein OdinLCB4_004195 [Candidatus Odinarchaeum yellowstonii]
MDENEVWPYVLILPESKNELKKVFNTLFKSSIPLEIIGLFSEHEKVYQPDIIKKFKAHSNKSILNYLKQLVDTKILETGIEKIRKEQRSFWSKWYKLTGIGRYILSIFNPRINEEEIKNLIRELFSIYVSKVMKIAGKYGITVEELNTLFQKALEKT